jgi:hypothetical protein
MTAAERIVRCACRLLPPALRDWGEAMAQEAASIERPLAAMAFALGCAAWVVREALRHPARTALGPKAVGPAPWSSRKVALACAVAATAAGLVYLAEAGAPARYLVLNVASLVAGLILVVPFRGRDPVTTPFVGVVAIVVGLILLLTASLGDEVSDTRRWLSLGDVALQPSLIGLPFLFVAFARSRDVLTAVGLVLGAVALALQPDRAMAGAMVAAIGVAALMKRDLMGLLMLSAALACFIVTTMRSDAAPTAWFVDGVLRSALSVSFTAGLAAWGGVAVLLLPLIRGLRRSPEAAAAYAAFGATWSALIVAAVFANHPAPVIAYGGSAIVGYVWSTLALPPEIHRPQVRIVV